MYSFVKKLFFNNASIKTFAITRLSDNQIEERVFLVKGKHAIDISRKHGMVCLDPFCIGVWVSKNEGNLFDPKTAKVAFYKGERKSASINVSLIETIEAEKCILLLYKIINVRNYQFTPLHRLALFSYLLRNKTSTYRDRKILSALYSYPRKIIIVSYRDEHYCNIFPMDIQGYIQEAGMYILGLRTTNVTLNKILEAKRVVVCDTDRVDIATVYSLGKHASAAPPSIEDFPFSTVDSDFFKFPVPEFCGSYKEIEIITSRKMGYHMLMVGKIVNEKIIRSNTSSLYHIGFLEYLIANYNSIEGQY